jgi:hypothetical protein
MPAFLQFFLQIFISVLISATVFAICAIGVLSTGNGIAFGFGSLYTPVSKSASLGAFVGVVHGLVTGLLICRYKPASPVGTTIASFLAMEILILIGIVAVCIYFFATHPPATSNAPPPNYVEAFGYFVLNTILWFGLASALFLVPSIVIGLVNRLFFKLFFPGAN